MEYHVCKRTCRKRNYIPDANVITKNRRTTVEDNAACSFRVRVVEEHEHSVHGSISHVERRYALHLTFGNEPTRRTHYVDYSVSSWLLRDKKEGWDMHDQIEASWSSPQIGHTLTAVPRGCLKKGSTWIRAEKAAGVGLDLFSAKYVSVRRHTAIPIRNSPRYRCRVQALHWLPTYYLLYLSLLRNPATTFVSPLQPCGYRLLQLSAVSCQRVASPEGKIIVPLERRCPILSTRRPHQHWNQALL